VPLSLSEIQADKDRLRAEFAMSTRRLEMSIKQFREKIAAQVVEISRNREELRQISADRSEKGVSIAELESRGSELLAELRQREDQLQKLAQRLADADRHALERGSELEKLGRMYEDASLSSSNKQIELVVRETEVDRLSADLNALRAWRKDAEQQMRDGAAESKELRDLVKAEKKKAADIEKKLERMLTTLTDREDKLDRREKEVERLRETMKESSATGDDLKQQLADARREKVGLEENVAALTGKISVLLSDTGGADFAKAMGKLEADRDKLERRLTTLTRENKKLRSALDPSKISDGLDESGENALLREQIHQLAAEVVRLTAVLDGPDSPINQLLSNGPETETQANGKITSLADRVRALQKAASVF
jgi:chromosome segregation ATPase